MPRVSYESTLAEVYNAHREQVDGLNLELTAHDEDLQQGHAAMNQWRTQWEEELTEKNSIDAELLTLRSEFEKSSATYDREIEGLKELLEKERLLREEMATALQGEEGGIAEHEKQLTAVKMERDALGEESMLTARGSGQVRRSPHISPYLPISPSFPTTLHDLPCPWPTFDAPLVRGPG